MLSLMCAELLSQFSPWCQSISTKLLSFSYSITQLHCFKWIPDIFVVSVYMKLLLWVHLLLLFPNIRISNKAMKDSDRLIIELILSSHVSELMVENFLECS